MVIDDGDRTCVALLIELRSQITGQAPGTVILLIASDPAAPLDLAAWCHLTGHAYLGPVHAPLGAPAYAAHQRRPPPDPAGLALAALQMMHATTPASGRYFKASLRPRQAMPPAPAIRYGHWRRLRTSASGRTGA